MTGKTSERSTPRGRGKDSLPEWVRAGSCVLPHRTRQVSSSLNFNRSLCWFVVLLALLNHFSVARATELSLLVPSSTLLTEKACPAAAAAHSARACMHAHNSSSIDRRPQFGSLTRSWIWIRALRMDFSSSLEFGYVLLGLFFSLPQLAIDLKSTPTMLDSSRHRSSISLTTAPGNHVKHSFRKAFSFEHSVSYPRPVITSRREEQNKAKVFQHPFDSHSQSASSCLISPHFAAGCMSESAAVQRVS